MIERGPHDFCNEPTCGAWLDAADSLHGRCLSCRQARLTSIRKSLHKIQEMIASGKPLKGKPSKGQPSKPRSVDCNGLVDGADEQ